MAGTRPAMTVGGSSMSEEVNVWAVGLSLPSEQVGEFIRISTALGSSPPELIRLMVEPVIALDVDLRVRGLSGLTAWFSGREAAEQGIEALPIDIRPSGFMWPPDLPFPWSADECRAAVLGYQVKWKGSFDDFLNRLPGVWEMSDGFAFLRQP
jgi:hypothetical protein